MNDRDWSFTTEAKRAHYTIMKRKVKYYKYSGQETAARTDEAVCDYFIKKLHEIKNKVFYLTQNSYELHKEDLTKKFDNLRLDVDIFSDEIKMRHSVFKNLNRELLGYLVEHDFHTIEAMSNFNQSLSDAHDKLMASKDINVKELRSELANIVILFKERELITNLKRVSLRKSYRRLSKEIEEKIGI